METLIVEEPIENLVRHARVPIAFVVDRVLSVTAPERGLEGIRLTETTDATPGVKDIHIVRSEAMRLGGQPGHQLIAEAKDDPSATPITMVQWLRFGPGRFLHMFGLARTDVWQSVFMRMRTLRDGIEPK